MGHTSIRLYWNKPNESPKSRSLVFRIETPVSGETTPVEDALLQLRNSVSTDIGTHEAEPTEDMAIARIKQVAADQRTKYEARCAELRESVRAAYPDGYKDVTNFRGEPNHMIQEAVAGHPDLEKMLDEMVSQRRAEVNEEMAQRKAAKAEQEARDNEYAARRREREEERKKQREAEIIAYAQSPAASDRLKLQVERGYDAWPLYLHELVQSLWPEAVLQEDLENEDAVSNPTESQLKAEVAVESAAKGRPVAVRNVRTVLVEADNDYYNDFNPQPYTVWDFRPGSAAFNWYTVAQPVD